MVETYPNKKRITLALAAERAALAAERAALAAERAALAAERAAVAAARAPGQERKGEPEWRWPGASLRQKEKCIWW